jgi:hypothetical protein
MRRVAVVALMTAALVTTAAIAQQPADKTPVVRYGVTANATFYPQGTAKEALASAAKALENKRHEYVVAHIMDPAAVDGLVAERAKRLEPEVEKELSARRADQRRSLAGVNPEDILPVTPPEFNERVKAEAEKRAFQSVVQSVRDNLGESPENARLMAKFTREGTIAENGAAATVTLKDVPNKQVYLKQAGARWHVEDRQTEDFKPKAEKAEK